MNTAPYRIVLCAVLLAANSAGAAEPTAHEQYVLELINRARADGNAEATRLGLSGLQDGSPAINGEPWTIQPAAPPLAWNEQLATAARNQAQALFTGNFFGGDPYSYGGTTAEQRMATAGYTTCFACPRPTTLSGFTPGVENFAFAQRSPNFVLLQTELDTMYSNVFRDSSTPGRLNRLIIMYPWFREIGPGLITGHVGSTDRAYLMLDFNKAAPGTEVFLTGVVYNDTVTANQFYTPGEGLGGLTVRAQQNGVTIAETTTWASGGYRMPLAAGQYQIKLVNTAGNIADMGTAVITSENVKRDSRSPVFSPPPVEVRLTIVRSAPGSVTLQWNDPTAYLSAGPSPAGPWTSIATVSPAIVPIQPGSRFFRCFR